MTASSPRLLFPLLAVLALGFSLPGPITWSGGKAPSSAPAADPTVPAEAAARAGAERPNIVLIVADDLGYGDLGSYGQRRIQTPHLDRMAREGMRFTQFYAGSTVCAPSRSVLMTGLHTGHTPIRGNQPVLPIGQAPLPPESKTVAEMLQEAGYRTGLFGKWGLGGPDSESTPRKQGFDTFFGYIDQRRAHYYWPEFLFASTADTALHRVPLQGNAVDDDPERHPGAGPPTRRGTYSHDRIVEEALSFIGAQAGGEQPFFAYLPVTIPHASLTVPEEALAPYTDANGNSIFEEEPSAGDHYTEQPLPRATYAAMVSRLDASVGQLMTRLEEQGVAENTIVLFTSDNGPHAEGGYDPAYFDSNGSLRGMKRDLYEGGIRVPLIAWGPGTVPAGAMSYHISYFGDLLATFAEWAGTQAPEPNDSISMVPALTGREDAQRDHDYLYWEFYAQGSKQAVRKGPWKAIRKPMGTGEMELYDLQKDLSERRNVASEHPEVVQQMSALMEAAHTPSPIWKVPVEE